MSQQRTPSPVGANLDTLTALRFFAAFMVFFTHATVIDTLAQGGRAGVSFFYILSGFVLTWAYRPGDGPAQFWGRRVARIVPAYLVAWAVGCAIDITHRGIHRALIAAIPGTLFVQAWFPQVDVHFAANGVGWSLSCETFFYLLFPLLVDVLWRLSTRQMAILLLTSVLIALAIPLVVRSSNPDSYWTYIFPPARLPEFVAGVAAGGLTARGWRCPVPLSVALLLAVAAYVAACFGPVWSASVAFTIAPYVLLLLSAAAADLGQLRPRPRTGIYRALVKLGVWSYCFYLVHQLVIKFAQHIHLAQRSGDAIFLFSCLAASLVASWSLFVLVEHPANRWLRRGRREPMVYSEVPLTADNSSVQS